MSSVRHDSLFEDASWPDGPLFLTKERRPLFWHLFVFRIQSSLVRAGIDPSSYNCHSLKIGAACHHSSSPGPQDSLIKSLGLWSSDTFQTYLKILRVHLATMTKSIWSVVHLSSALSLWCYICHCCLLNCLGVYEIIPAF